MICLPIAVRFSRALDALVLGEDTAVSLGVAVPRIRLLLIVLMAMCTGVAVAETGLVAFVGLVAPHLVRRSVIVTHGPLLYSRRWRAACCCWPPMWWRAVYWLRRNCRWAC